MIERKKVEQGIINMLKVNMGVRRGERLLIITDTPTTEERAMKESRKLAEMKGRFLLAKRISEIATEKFPNCRVQFYSYPSVGRHGAELKKEVEEKMKKADVVIALTTYSLSHTEARENATKAGTRIASMPNFAPEMLYPLGPMVTDYTKIHEECQRIAYLIDKASKVILTSPSGTDLRFSLEGRKSLIDDGILTKEGAFGNLPAGEVYTAPVEGTTNGILAVNKGWYENLTENMTFMFSDGQVTTVIGGGTVGDEFRNMLACEKNEEPYLSRRNCAELGIGTNPNAKHPDNVLEAEKIKETVHIAIGDNSHMGGRVTTDLHQDFIIPKSTLMFDDNIIMKDGKFIQ